MTAPRSLSCEEIRDLSPLFVTGTLEPDEMTAVREHLADCDDAHLELLELGEAATALLETVEPAEPPASLKSRLLEAAAADLDGRQPAQAPAKAVPVVAAASDREPSKVIDLGAERDRRRGRIGWLVAVAAVIAILVLAGLNLSLRRDLDAAQAYRDGVNQALELAAQPGSTTALLAGSDGDVSGFAVVGADGTVRMTLRGLAPTTGSQVYTAWVIEGESAPVPIGEFTAGASGIVTASAASPTATPGAILALTLEPTSGATAPTLPIVASGVTGAPAG